MRKYTITAHMMVKNEANWIWYAIMSVIDFVDAMIIFDTGSTDETVKIIKSIVDNEKYSKKIIFEEKGEVDIRHIKDIRQEQISMTKTDYFFVVDGDEIWYKETLENIRKQLNQTEPRIKLLWTEMLMVAGDVYHARNNEREKYHMVLRDETGKKTYERIGAYTIRFFSMDIPGINCMGDYGVEGFFDNRGCEVQAGPYKTELSVGYYFHASYLPRASSILGDLSINYRANKHKEDWDYKLPGNFIYPEVFYRQEEAKVDIFNPFVLRVSNKQILRHVLKRIKNICKRILCYGNYVRG